MISNVDDKVVSELDIQEEGKRIQRACRGVDINENFVTKNLYIYKQNLAINCI